MRVRASVVVPSYKRPELLTRCLAALALQTIDPAAYEIVVADNAASEETKRIVHAMAGKARSCLRYVNASQSRGPAAARNAGWKAARGEIIAFTDDDCVPDPKWIEAGLAAFEDGVIGVRGRLIMPLPEEPTDYERNAAHLEDAEFVTANCFYRRDALALAGGFDERFTDAWREDSDLFFSLLQRNGRLVHAPEAIVVHPIRPARWGVSLGQQRKNLFNALLYKKHPKLYRERIQANPPWHYYAAAGSLLAAAAGAWVGGRAITAGAVAVWLFLSARFCLRRLHRTSHAPTHALEMAVTSLLIPPLAIFWRILGAIRYRVLFL